MTIDDKREALIKYCHEHADNNCNGCAFCADECCVYDGRRIDESYDIAFNGEQNVLCEEIITCNRCQFYECDEEDFPCNDCIHDRGSIDHFTPLNSGTTQEEINHPDRYAGGKFECIDVMLDVFGADAVKHFCILNAFKYIWRAEKKNGVEDIKKAVWYLNKFIELGGVDGESKTG